MQGSSTFAYQLDNSQAISYSSLESTLITLGRVQKLDLLIHLITNLRQSLVICGANGIGKTSLLNELQKRKKECWIIINVATSVNLSFEAVQDQLQQFIVLDNPEYKNYDLPSILSDLDKQRQKVALILDDVSSLVPGLINSLIQYADANTCLRVVFSITNDDLVAKNSTDSAIDSCHFVEIPPLTEIQCGVFLRDLSAKPEASVSLTAITDSLVEKIYKETHGIPGEIVSALENRSKNKVVSRVYWQVVVGAVIFVGVVFFLLKESPIEEKKQIGSSSIISATPEHVNISAPIVSSVYRADVGKIDNGKDVIIDNRVEDLLVTKVALEPSMMVAAEMAPPLGGQRPEPLVEEIGNDLFEQEKTNNIRQSTFKPVEIIVTEIKAIKKKFPVVLTEPEKPNVRGVKKEKEIKTEVDDRQWLLKQPHKNHTIQLIALSTRKAVLGFLAKNKALKARLKFLRMTTQGKEKYLVMYGTFDTRVMALKEMKELPVKYRKSWIRKIRDLQKVIK